MTQTALFDIVTFKGETVTTDDVERLEKQLTRVEKALSDGCWIDLDKLGKKAKCPPASASARIRQLRSMGRTIEHKNCGNGYWLYRWRIEEDAK